MKRYLIPFLLFCSLAVAETGYRVTHPDGTVEFTDQPVTGGEEIELRNAPTTTFVLTAPTPGIKEPSASSTNQETGQRYSDMTIQSPQPEETRWFDESGLNVMVAVSPALFSGHSVRLWLDGQLVASGAKTSFTLTEVYRGSHTLSAEVVDQNGDVQLRTSPITFHLRQHSAIP